MTYGIRCRFGMAFDGLFDDIPTRREVGGPLDLDQNTP
jgi:hypothetical protein